MVCKKIGSNGGDGGLLAKSWATAVAGRMEAAWGLSGAGGNGPVPKARQNALTVSMCGRSKRIATATLAAAKNRRRTTINF